MAGRSLHRLLSAAVLPYVLLAIQVAPNSPCSSVCVDSTTLDLSDPNSSNTLASDIVCEDADFTSTSEGKKWKQCMTCLQSSTFVQGSESDQYWFLYNLRYNFDHCVFGPNGTESGLTPCAIDLACGSLKSALEYGNLSTSSPEFGYCDADGGSVTGVYHDACHSCVSSSGTTQYVANTLVALEAGCQQRPNVTNILGLNSTVYSTAYIGIVDPASLVVDSSTASVQLSMGAIAGIAVGAVVVILIVAACVLIQRHKRKKRAAIGTRPRWGSMPKTHKRKSSFSFRCRHILSSPISPKFFRDDLSPVEENKQFSSLDQIASSQVSGITGEEQSKRYYLESKSRPQRPAYEPAWSPQYAPPSFQSFDLPPEKTEDPVQHAAPDTSERAYVESKLKPKRPAYEPVWSPQFAPPSSQSFATPPGTMEEPGQQIASKPPLSINTAPAPPEPAHQSPKQDTFSVLKAIHNPLPPRRSTSRTPVDPHSSTSSPGSRTNMTTMSSQGTGYPNFKSPDTSSPLLKQKAVWPSPRENPDGWSRPPSPPGPSPSSFRYGRKASASSMRRKRESGSPVETRQIQVSFPAPPPN